MQIIERKDAKLLGLKTYYTGKPCTNQHLAYRYTESGSCSECINGRRKEEGGKAEPTAEELESVRQRVAAKNELNIMRFRADFSDAPALIDYAHALTMARYPLVEPALLRKGVPHIKTQGTNAMVGMLLHPSDHGVVDQMRAALWSKHTMGAEGVQRLREQIFGEAAKLAEKMNTNSGPVGGYDSIPR